MQFSNVVTTTCGHTFQIDMFEQLAVGIIPSENLVKDQSYIPDTFAVYHTASDTYLLEKTIFKLEDMSLETSYQILTENQAVKYLDNCLLDLS
ncbi:hypothetical protein [Adhaeribacter pallidiroseus]|uniref:Uncharacterized protein n=1 Tax=Adhaeribacter pallidiroseus TaxID=2072847 RepID=A0A369QQC8_9BACT|nr:hypothetical protein [Adhaeribacter pallidiroseus]RDC65885.1 hypothetical protein AHMF7616_04516 [Adhaeribacter pallidiroseus]